MTFSIRPKARPSAREGRVACSESVAFGSRPLWANAGSPAAAGAAASRPGRGACGGRAGIALVITMIMLAVITTLAIAFLAITHRETGAVDQMARTTDSELVCGSGMERAKAEIAAVFRMRNYFTNGLEIMGPDLIVSVVPSLDESTNRLYPGRLKYDASPPVFVDTNRAGQNGSAEDRFFLDLNRNGVFEHTGYVPVTTDALGPKPGTFAYLLNAGIIVTNYMVGDPQWIGELHDPTIPHGPNNRFIGRYAYLIQPIGRSLDVNWIHNDAKVDTDPLPG